MPPVETFATEPFGREVYNRLPDIRNRLRVLDLDAGKLLRQGTEAIGLSAGRVSAFGTEPINDDDIRASIDAVALPSPSNPPVSEIYKRAFDAAIESVRLASSAREGKSMALRRWRQKHTTPDDGWKQLFEKLESFGDLPRGWDGYTASPPTADALFNAQEFLGVLFLATFRPSRFKPSVVGGIGVTFRQGDRKVYVEFYNDGRVHSLMSDGATEPRTKRVRASYSGYLKLLREIRKYLNA